MSGAISSIFVKEGAATLPLCEVKTGAELGIKARECKVKSVQSILELAATVHKAYDRYYEPWAKVGRKSRPIQEQVADQAEWADFLSESGYEMPRHAKLLRNLWAIGRRLDSLAPNSANLPNSIETLATICNSGLNEEEFDTVVAELHPASTTKEVKKFLTVMRQLPDDLDDDTGLSEAFEVLEQKTKAQRFTAALVNPVETLPRNLGLGAIAATKDNLVDVAVAFLVGPDINLQLPDINSFDQVYEGRLLETYKRLAHSSEWIAMRKRILKSRLEIMSLASQYKSPEAA